MKLSIIIDVGGKIFHISSEEIEDLINRHCICGFSVCELELCGYLKDEEGNICGIKGKADHGHGYGFNYGFREFELKTGETFSYDYSTTSIDDPSDWSNEDTRITLKLIAED